MKLSELFSSWRELAVAIPAHDRPMLSESWNDYTDAACKNGDITSLQFKFCPSHDDKMPSNDYIFVLDMMGVSIKAVRIDARTSSTLNNEWSNSASHYHITMTRKGAGPRTVVAFEYSMGSAHTRGPKLDDVFYAVLSDSMMAEHTSFESWCDEYGFDSDSRSAEASFKECVDMRKKLDGMFSRDELISLNDLFAEF